MNNEKIEEFYQMNGLFFIFKNHHTEINLFSLMIFKSNRSNFLKNLENDILQKISWQQKKLKAKNWKENKILMQIYNCNSNLIQKLKSDFDYINILIDIN